MVGSVVHHEIEEEEYDPRRPLIGRVASTVRVGQRRLVEILSFTILISTGSGGQDDGQQVLNSNTTSGH